MTDSMKFGPEWLRNMSADSTSSSSINNSNQINAVTTGYGSGSSGVGADGTSVNNATNNNNLSSLNHSCLHNNVNSSTLSGASRNTFPEFRYGREEMLLLFDRNCTIPEILPSYKNLFVERVQFPLALVPSTDEDMIQGSVPPTQRPGWLQRSPVGFSTATRGTGRVGCMERGRMRGKSIYHPVFQRPNALFDDEQRSSTIKAERSWAERNGGPVGDLAVSGSSTIVGGGLGPDTWNGNTPVSSPRREFSNHPRNMENWRRGRNEEGSAAETSNSTSTTFSSEGGWRINTSAFQNSQTRWGRSTSWRDDELANSYENSAISCSSGGVAATTGVGGGIMMLRSNSAISSTQSERVGHLNSTGKQIGTPGITRSISVASSSVRNTGSDNIWPNNSSSAQMPNIQGSCNTNDEMPLPEWAMENPSDIGGTFDASGAFHGAVDDDGNVHHTEKQKASDLPQQQFNEEEKLSESDVQEELQKDSEDDNNETKSPFKETDNYYDTATPSPIPPTNNTNENSSCDATKCDMSNQNSTINNSPHKQSSPINTAIQVSLSQKNIDNFEENLKESEQIPSTNEENSVNSNAGDYAERMMKVTDDMIEKLIMDDDDAKGDHIKSGSNKKNDQQHVFISGLSRPQTSSHPTTVSPALVGGAGPAGPPNISLYNMGGMLVDHTHNMASLHQLQQQQMATVAAVAIGLQTTPPPQRPITSSAPTDLWLYRDPQSKVQGPFSALEMTEWYRAGYFNENLFVRRACDARFRPLGELIKICNGQMPFSHSHLIPFDLNPTQLTPPPPLVPVMSAHPSGQATDFVMKTLNEHQQQHEKLKGNVTAAADSLSNALKNLINSVDISQVLNMHFQTLQDRFIQNQEIEIVNELSKNECFRRLSSAEQKAIVRQKLQMMSLPEYLTNLTGLSNSLAALNPTAGTQLYDTIAECTKKEQLFTTHQQQSQLSAQQQPHARQQRPNHTSSSSSLPFINPEDFIIKSKDSGHDLNNDLLNEFNLRMFLNNGSNSITGGSGNVASQNSPGHEFLNDQQLFGTTGTSATNAPNVTSPSPMMQMWMNSLSANQTNTLPTQQHPLTSNAQQGPGINNQWLNGPLVGIPSISLAREQHSSGSIMSSPKPTSTPMWDVATLEQHVQVQQQKQPHQQQEQQLQHQIQQQYFEHQCHLKNTELLNRDQLHQDASKQHQNLDNEQETKKENKELKPNDVNCSSTNHNNGKEDHHQSPANDKPPTNNKRNNTNNNTAKSSIKAKNDSFVEQGAKKIEEDRRRELNEDKRRQKEERKRQQIEEERRRLLQAEEEKRRQIQEEEKRQQQIQAQRRKALMTSTSNNSFSYNTNNANNINNGGNQKLKEQQRIQSSVAPWSTQTMTTKAQGPGLAEIQKAERRERRADQQRQLEIQERQLRALAAAAEAQDTVLKWNASPVPVKSFVEIQAEEAKRLAHEQMEFQRRKELEAHNNFVGFSSAGNFGTGGLSSSSNISSIWSGNKIWGTSSNTSGFWEEHLKFNVSSAFSQSSTVQQKSTAAQQLLSSTQQNKNIKKSQSVAVMQNTTSSLPNARVSGGPNSQKKSLLNTISTTKQAKPQKPDSIGSTACNENKKSTAKNHNSTVCKSDDFETEFTNWCIKSLNNMNTKVDVPTFVSFLRDLESPYEVKDYIRMYLGESKEYIDFAKQFLERRSKYKNLQRAQNAHDDDLCKPAQAITPSVNDNNENKGKQKKIKKNKMTKLDARILGFSVTAAEGRINVGDRDYGDAP